MLFFRRVDHQANLAWFAGLDDGWLAALLEFVANTVEFRLVENFEFGETGGVELFIVLTRERRRREVENRTATMVNEPNLFDNILQFVRVEFFVHLVVKRFEVLELLLTALMVLVLEGDLLLDGVQLVLVLHALIGDAVVLIIEFD